MSIGMPFNETNVAASATNPSGATSNKLAQLGVSVVQPILRDAGTQVNLASIEASGLLMRQTDARTKLSVISTLAAAERAYWQYYAS